MPATPRCGSLRGEQMAMIFQDPMTSFNPVYRIGRQIVEAIQAHRPETKDAEARERVDRAASTRSASPTPPAGSTTTRTNSPAACGSGR